MRAGKVQQVDRPQNLYARPANLFVAACIGSPAMNLVEARISGGSVQFAGFEIPLAPDRRPRVQEDSVVILGIRPEDFQDAAFAGPELPLIEVVADVIEELGSDTHVFFRVDAPRVNTEDSRAAVSGEDDTLLADDRATFAARVGPSTTAVAGASIKIGVNSKRFHFFDRDTGANLLQLEKRHLVGVPA
jgi:multiple sugar transport system ATP-binding protein